MESGSESRSGEGGGDEGLGSGGRLALLLLEHYAAVSHALLLQLAWLLSSRLPRRAVARARARATATATAVAAVAAAAAAEAEAEASGAAAEGKGRAGRVVCFTPKGDVQVSTVSSTLSRATRLARYTVPQCLPLLMYYHLLTKYVLRRAAPTARGDAARLRLRHSHLGWPRLGRVSDQTLALTLTPIQTPTLTLPLTSPSPSPSP